MRVKNSVKSLGGKLFGQMFPLYPRLKDFRLILMYHRVLREIPREICDPALYVTETTFEMHLREMSGMFRIVPLQTLMGTQSEGKRVCAITFDDGWIDNYEVALPLLKKYRAPATIFIPAATIGSNRLFWFESLWKLADEAMAIGAEDVFIEYFRGLVPSWNPDRLTVNHLSSLGSRLKDFPGDKLDDLIDRAYLKLEIAPPVQKTILDWGQIAEMGQSGITFGSHGMNHFILPTLAPASKRNEIFESLQILREKAIAAIPYFSFPNGDWDQDSLAAVSGAGYLGGLTAKIGYNTSKTNPFLLARVGLHEYISHTPELFWFRLFQGVLAGSG